jgi:glucose-6-phosphate 1-epimerase
VYNIANYFGYLLDLLTAFVVLRLTQNTKTLALWPHNFQLDLRVELMQHASKGPALRMELSATNNSTSAFSFTSALHSYYTTQHVFNAAVTPLQHLTYYDKTTQSEKLQDDALVKITAETDRVYYKYESGESNQVRKKFVLPFADLN